MIRHRFPVRALIAFGALACTLALGGCNTDAIFPNSPSKANAPLSPAMLAEIEQKNMTKESPILIRLFKEEAELEVWKQDRSGQYALLKSYPICRWSGDLGPKIKEGDRQAPEGFYAITPALMNPNSQYHLAFNLGFPNAFDKAWGRTGAFLMVHGDCSSRGCYAMTDEQISEIFALGRESFFGGQKAFQVQAYPFRMTPLNMARHRNSPHYAFWKMIKEGNDHFEATHLEPKVNVCERRYVFNAQAPANASPLRFDPKGKCPVYEVPEEIATLVNDKQRTDEIRTAELVSRGTPTAPSKRNVDGGMNPVFAAALQKVETRDGGGNIALVSPIKTEQGTIPTSVNPPRDVSVQVAAAPSEPVAAETVAPAPPAPAPQKTAARELSLTEKISSLFKPNKNEAVSAQAPAEPKAKSPNLLSRMLASKSEPKERPQAKEAKAVPTPSARENTAASPTPRANPGDADRFAKSAAAAPAPAPVSTGVIAGAQPIVPTASFESRWNAF